MHYRKPSKNYDLFSALSKKRGQETQEVGILKLYKIIDWEGFRGLMEEIAGYSSRDSKKGGRPPFDPILMLTFTSPFTSQSPDRCGKLA